MLNIVPQDASHGGFQKISKCIGSSNWLEPGLVFSPGNEKWASPAEPHYQIRVGGDTQAEEGSDPVQG